MWCYNKWLCGDPTSSVHGYLDDSISTHYGQTITWQFGTSIIYNESRGAVIHQLELVSLTGRVELGKNPTISTAYSTDGENWSQEKFVSAGTIGQSNKRIVWFQQGALRNWRLQRFTGTSDAHISMLRLEANIEALNV